MDGHPSTCDRVGRDYDSIKKTYFGFVSVSRDGAKPEPRGDLHIVYGAPDKVAGEMRQFVDLGVEHFMLRFVDFPSMEGLELFLNDVASRV